MKHRNGKITPNGLLEAGFKLDCYGMYECALGGRSISVAVMKDTVSVYLCDNCEHVVYATTMSQLRMLKSVWLGVVEPTPRTEETYDE